MPRPIREERPWRRKRWRRESSKAPRSASRAGLSKPWPGPPSASPKRRRLRDRLRRRGLRAHRPHRAPPALTVDLFTLDTGLLFPETYALWRRLEERYGAHDPRGAAGPDRRGAGASPRRAALGARARPLLRAAEGRAAASALARPRAPGSLPSAATRRADRADGARRRAGPALLGLVKVNPLARWTQRRRLGLRARARRAREPAARARLPEHRLPALHEPGRPRRGPARRPLARQREDRVRAARPSRRVRPSRCTPHDPKEPRAMSLTLAETALVRPHGGVLVDRIVARRRSRGASRPRGRACPAHARRARARRPRADRRPAPRARSTGFLGPADYASVVERPAARRRHGVAAAVHARRRRRAARR